MTYSALASQQKQLQPRDLGTPEALYVCNQKPQYAEDIQHLKVLKASWANIYRTCDTTSIELAALEWPLVLRTQVSDMLEPLKICGGLWMELIAYPEITQ